MTREEYRAKTEIKDAEEASAYLLKLNIFFIAVFVYRIGFSFALNFFAVDLSPYYQFELILSVLPAIGLTFYCSRIIQKTKKVTKAQAVWAILFAPISWVWFYPELTKPLKIILGKIDPPDHIQTHEERNLVEKEANERAWTTFKVVAIISGLLLLFMTTAFVIAIYLTK